VHTIKNTVALSSIKSAILRRAVLSILSISLLFASSIGAQEGEWFSHARVARKVIEKFKAVESYTADFTIATVDGKKTNNMSGKIYYQKPNFVRFEFSRPAGNEMISDGRTLWVYIKRINAAGKQDLRLNKKDENSKLIFSEIPGPGLIRLFRKYHYRFDTPKQPRKESGRNVFVLDLEQREKIGGYEKMVLHIDAKDYLVTKAIASDDYGKVSTISFSNMKLNVPLDGALFQYKPGRSVRVVNNPLVSE